MNERQEIYCHECGKYVQFNIDTELIGNHVLECPNCGHEHCRVVERGGKITDVRWGQRNSQLPTYQVSSYNITSSATSTYDTYTSYNSGGTSTGYSLWMNTTTYA